MSIFRRSAAALIIFAVGTIIVAAALNHSTDSAAPASINYVTLNAGHRDVLVCASNTTYYVTGPIQADELILQGGAVIKFAPAAGARLSADSIRCETGPYHKAVLTARDDDTVGAVIAGSTGSPTGYYADIALEINQRDATELECLRIAFAEIAISYPASDAIGLTSARHMQIVHCGIGFRVISDQRPFSLGNALLDHVHLAFDLGSAGGVVEHLTFAHGDALAVNESADPAKLTITRSILADVARPGIGPIQITGRDNGFHRSPVFGSSSMLATSWPFESIGAGDFYLPVGSPFRNGGGKTSADLQATLQSMTTYPPAVYSRILFPGGTTLNPQTPRNDPAIGYHYDPIDYAVSEVKITGDALAIGEGAAVATFGKIGFIPDNTAIVIEGSQLVHYSAVQEQPRLWMPADTGEANVAGNNGAPGGAGSTTQPNLLPRTATPVKAAKGNQPPTVTLTSPTNGDLIQLYLNSGPPLIATASDSDGTITKVDFYETGNFLGTVSNAPYTMPWPGLPAGTYRFYAVAYDNSSASTTSSVVRVDAVYGFTDYGDDEDAYAQNGANAGLNVGNVDPLKVQTNATAANNFDTYIKFFPFDPGNLRRARFVFTAKLNSAGSMPVAVYLTGNNWSETSITWNNKPARSNLLAAFTVQTTTNTQFAVDVTSLYLSALHSGQMLALALHSTANSTATALIPSRDEAFTNFSVVPYLETWSTNNLPVGVVQSPADGSQFNAGANIPITAFASSPGGTVTNVAFYAGSTLIAKRSAPPWTVTWSNAPADSYALTVRVTDNTGQTGTSAAANITVLAPNIPPTVSLTAPTNSAVFSAPATVSLAAQATDTDGTISSVEFFQGVTSLGISSTVPYNIIWSNAPAGTYTLSARATDDRGGTTTSTPINITVLGPPVITLQPQSQATFPGGNATFAVSASGGQLNYQWQFNATNLPGPSGSALTISNAQPFNAGNYRVIVSNIAGSVTSSPALLTLGIIGAWGDNTFGQTTLAAWMTNNVAAISAGSFHNLALRSDGTVMAWGANGSLESSVPAGLSNVVAISAGEAFSLALKNSGSTLGWGSNNLGQITIPASATNLIAIEAGHSHAIAIRNNNTLVAWGANQFGQTNIPVGLSNVVAVSSYDHNLALKKNGTVTAWGWNAFGQTNVPAGLSNVMAIAAGPQHNLVVRSNGTVVAWGDNTYGQLNIPAGLSNVFAVAAGGTFSLALKSDGTVVKWGGKAGSGGDIPAPPGLNNAIAISAGINHSLVLLTNNANLLPYVSLSSPPNNSTFTTPTNVAVSATASDWDGTIAHVDFYSDGQLLATSASPPYSFTWTNPVIGIHALTAIATDNFAGTLTSAPVTITITTALSALADAHVKSATPTNNFGTATSLEVLTAASDNRVAYFRFDLGSAPIITSARLRIFAALSANGTVGTTAFSVPNTNWSETGITWNNRPPLGSALGSTNVSGRTLAWYEIDVGSYIKSEKLAGRNVVSLALTNLASSSANVLINSREATSNRPQLILSNTNKAPSITFTSPANGAGFIAPAAIPISATATDSDGTISKVEFFAGTTSLGVRTSAPYSVTWSNVGSGTYMLTAVATDNNGATTTSAPISVNVNAAPLVSLSSPGNNAVYPAPAVIAIAASASDTDGTISQVEFFAGTTSLGIRISPPYSLVWSNVGSGTYSLTAVAADHKGATTTSMPVSVRVNSSPTVQLTAPTNNALILSPANIQLTATAADNDGTIAGVQFFTGTNSLGISTTPPFSVTWSNVAGGTYSLTAIAFDHDGAQSMPSTISVIVDAAPSVILTNPLNGAQFIEPASIPLAATAFDSDGTVARVEFFSGAMKIAEVDDPPFTTVWSNAPVGTYLITAIATDNAGASTASAGVGVTVFPKAVGTNSPVRLSYWRFETTNWPGEEGQAPLSSTNIESFADGSNHVLRVNHVGIANLKYRDVEAGGSPNIDVANGSIAFWFRPDWSSAGAGGSGPGNIAQLISLGQRTDDASIGCWSFAVSADGSSLTLLTQTNGLGSTNFTATISWASNEWHQIIVTYTSSNSALYIDALPVVTNGLGIACYPNAFTRAVNGINVGSDTSGNEQARGEIDELETFNYPLSAAEILQHQDSDNDGIKNITELTLGTDPHNADSDGDGLPDGWELRHGLNPLSGLGNDGAAGDPDGDGVDNLTEFRQGRNSRVVGTVADTNDVIHLKVFTPLK